jgi:hypothetical protein
MDEKQITGEIEIFAGQAAGCKFKLYLVARYYFPFRRLIRIRKAAYGQLFTLLKEGDSFSGWKRIASFRVAVPAANKIQIGRPWAAQGARSSYGSGSQ